MWHLLQLLLVLVYKTLLLLFLARNKKLEHKYVLYVWQLAGMLLNMKKRMYHYFICSTSWFVLVDIVSEPFDKPLCKKGVGIEKNLHICDPCYREASLLFDHQLHTY